MFTRPTRGHRACLGLLCWLAGAAALSGCSKDTVKLAAVEGTVTVDGKVLAMDAHSLGTVILHPDKSKGNESLEIPRGPIDSEGKFKILTGIKPGVTPGRYRVTLNAAKVLDPKNPYHTASDFLIPERYMDKFKSNLAFEVVENAPAGTYDLKLDSR
jgi:hypothetical protein